MIKGTLHVDCIIIIIIIIMKIIIMITMRSDNMKVWFWVKKKGRRSNNYNNEIMNFFYSCSCKRMDKDKRKENLTNLSLLAVNNLPRLSSDLMWEKPKKEVFNCIHVVTDKIIQVLCSNSCSHTDKHTFGVEALQLDTFRRRQLYLQPTNSRFHKTPFQLLYKVCTFTFP